MDNSNLKRIHLSFFPSFEESCKVHHHFGDLPCPWPDCLKGIEDDCFFGVTHGFPGLEEKKYIRKAWQALDGSARFSWDDTTNFSYYGLRKIIREENLRCIGPDPQLPNIVCHYTSVEAMFKIVSSNEMWLTDHEYMNDSREIIHGLDVAKKIFKEIEENPLYSEQQDIVHAWEQFLEVKSTDRIYIGCFSTEDDNLSQWKGYGGTSTGVSIGLDITDSSFWYGYTQMQLGRVVYEESKQSEILRNIFHICLTMSDWDKDKEIIDSQGKAIPPERGRNRYKDYIGDTLREFIVFFKDESFKDEKEIRWVYQENNQLDESFGIPIIKRQFRVKGNQIIPYTTSSDLASKSTLNCQGKREDNKLPIKRIVVGPQENALLVMAGVKDYLNYFGYDPGIVRLSLVPFRPGK